MEQPPADQAAEQIKLLQRCVNDLVSVLALPVLWSGREPPDIVQTLLDALLRTLRLDFACVSLTMDSDQKPLKIVRVGEAEAPPLLAQDVLDFVDSVLGADWNDGVLQGRHRIAETDVSITWVPLGLSRDMGVVLAGGRRADFPSQTDSLVLSVATNQALIGLGEARLLREQKRVTKELDGRVAERTEELARANEGLRNEIEERARVEDALREARSELAHVTRVTTLGALTASIAHEINQPLSGILTNAATCLRMLSVEVPDLDGLRETVHRTIRDGRRAADVVTRLRALFANKPVSRELFDLNDATREIVALTTHELWKGSVALRLGLKEGLPRIAGDRVQLQQVVLNLVLNAKDAMSEIADRPRELGIETGLFEGDCVLLSVRDSGIGLDPGAATRLFEPFYTTKQHGMGMGLSISQAIVQSHGGRIWAAKNDGPGSTFSFAIPLGSVAANG